MSEVKKYKLDFKEIEETARFLDVVEHFDLVERYGFHRKGDEWIGMCPHGGDTHMNYSQIEEYINCIVYY